ncbi:MAG: glycosyltransferase family 4 protein, partial [Acidimicrobiales bacterium]
MLIDGRIIFREQCRGIGRAVIGLVEQFPTQAEDGTVKMLVQRGGVSPFDLTEAAKRVELVETDLPVMALHRVLALRRLLERLDAGVFFSPYHPFTPLAAPCPVVSAVHDCIWEEDPAFAGGRPRQLSFELLTRLSLSRAKAISVPSKATARAVHRYYPHVAGTEVISNGVTFRTAGKDTAATVDAARGALGLPPRYLLHVGARRPHKNQAFLLEVLARLDPTLSLVLIGDRDPRMADEVDQTIRRLGLADRVLALQKVPDQYMAGLYEGASAFVFPSLVEGYGIPPLEAMTAGTPVVASAIPVMAEVCGDAALLVSPFDVDGWVSAVERVLADPALARSLT